MKNNRFIQSSIVWILLVNGFWACSLFKTKHEEPPNVDALPPLEEASVDTLPAAPAGGDSPSVENTETHPVPLPSTESVSMNPPPSPLPVTELQVPVQPEVSVAAIEQPSEKPFTQSSSESPKSTVEGPQEAYLVQAGDTLMKIAFEKYGHVSHWKAILRSNPQLSDGNRLEKGMTLQLDKNALSPPLKGEGEPYWIIHGDTLSKISGKVYGTPSHWRALWENNRGLIVNPDKIYAGFSLFYQPLTTLTQRSLASQGVGLSSK